jgi:hypothetical protein
MITEKDKQQKQINKKRKHIEKREYHTNKRKNNIIQKKRLERLLTISFLLK